MGTRLVVTGHKGGVSTVVSDEVRRGYAFVAVPGMVQNSLWATDQPTSALDEGGELAVNSLLPPSGGTRLSVVSFPPDSQFGAPEFDPVAAAVEFSEKLPGLADTFESENPGMHRTPTLDYIIVLSGAIVLELDHGETVVLNQHDIVVQNGTRHAWRNPFKEAAMLAVVMVGQQSA